MSTDREVDDLPDEPAEPDEGAVGADDELIDADTTTGGIGSRRGGWRRTQKWSRIVHVYTSMLCFVVVLFFALTGITLNHPNWVFGDSGSKKTASGTLPSNWKSGDTVDWLNIAEYLRTKEGVSGSVSNHSGDADQGSISFKGPGYAADAFIDMRAGTYDLTIESQGLVAVMNDLHKGRGTASSWKWLIDVAGGFLAVISLSGMLLQLFLRRRRRSAFVTLAVGAAVLALMIGRTVA